MDPPSEEQRQALISNMTSDTTALTSQLTNMPEDEALDLVATFASAVSTGSSSTTSSSDASDGAGGDGTSGDGATAEQSEEETRQLQEVRSALT